MITLEIGEMYSVNSRASWDSVVSQLTSGDDICPTWTDCERVRATRQLTQLSG